MFDKGLKNVVVAVESGADARYVFDKLRKLLARVEGEAPTVHVVRVVHAGIADLKSRRVDQSLELKSLILQATERELVDVLDACATGIDRLESMALWNAKTWEGILHFAEANHADLIVKASPWQGANRTLGRTPDDWHLLRHASVPVLLVKDATWPAHPRVVAAIDAFDEDHGGLGVHTLQAASVLRSLVDGEELQIVSVYPALDPWIARLDPSGGYSDLRDNIAADVGDEIGRLVTAAEVEDYRVQVAEGPTVGAIESAVESSRADVLTIGSHARDGVKGVVLGNTAEKLLFEVDVDLLVVRVAAGDSAA